MTFPKSCKTILHFLSPFISPAFPECPLVAPVFVADPINRRLLSASLNQPSSSFCSSDPSNFRGVIKICGFWILLTIPSYFNIQKKKNQKRRRTCSFVHSCILILSRCTPNPVFCFQGKLYIFISPYISPCYGILCGGQKGWGGTANAKEWGIKVRFQYRGEVQPGGWVAADCGEKVNQLFSLNMYTELLTWANVSI